MAQEIYEGISVDDLVLFAAKRVLDGGEECTFERLVYECFTLFPKTFALQRYPQWPDSARVNKSWHRCRTDKGWMVGSVKEGFRLTPKGELVAARVTKRLALASTPTPKPQGRARERFEAALRQIRQSEPFRRYLTDPASFHPTEAGLRNLLGGTLETPIRVLRQNWHYYKEIATTYDDKDVSHFLDLCRSLLQTLSKPQRTEAE